MWLNVCMYFSFRLAEVLSPKTLPDKRSAISWISLHELPVVESQKEGPQCASVCLPLFFHRLFDCDFITEFDVKSVLDAGKVMKPIQAGRSPVWLSLFLIMIYILEI